MVSGYRRHKFSTVNMKIRKTVPGRQSVSELQLLGVGLQSLALVRRTGFAANQSLAKPFLVSVLLVFLDIDYLLVE
jgi:hypothetical protein